MSMTDKEQQRVVGIIPAKAGSTRLPRKNILPLGGKPLLTWAAEAAFRSGIFDDVVLSTEDENVAEIGRTAKLDVPFLRPQKMAVDPAGVSDVALHVLEELQKIGRSYDIVVIMLPTCPFRSADDIKDAFKLFMSRSEPNLMSVAPFDHTPFAALSVDERGVLAPHFPEYFGRKAQDMPLAYRPNGALHILNVAWFQKSRSYLAAPVLSYIMPRERSIDIDTAEDLVLAETMLV